jgi:hypothetical protein
VASLLFLRCCAEKAKGSGSHHFIVSLLYFSAFQTEENDHFFPNSLFSISLFPNSLQTNRPLKRKNDQPLKQDRYQEPPTNQDHSDSPLLEGNAGTKIFTQTYFP